MTRKQFELIAPTLTWSEMIGCYELLGIYSPHTKESPLPKEVN